MIENLKVTSSLAPVTNSAKIQKTSDRDGRREKRRFEEELGREDLQRESAQEDRREEDRQLLDADVEKETLDEGPFRGKMVNLRV